MHNDWCYTFYSVQANPLILTRRVYDGTKWNLANDKTENYVESVSYDRDKEELSLVQVIGSALPVKIPSGFGRFRGIFNSLAHWDSLDTNQAVPNRAVNDWGIIEEHSGTGEGATLPPVYVFWIGTSTLYLPMPRHITSMSYANNVLKMFYRNYDGSSGNWSFEIGNSSGGGSAVDGYSETTFLPPETFKIYSGDTTNQITSGHFTVPSSASFSGGTNNTSTSWEIYSYITKVKRVKSSDGSVSIHVVSAMLRLVNNSKTGTVNIYNPLKIWLSSQTLDSLGFSFTSGSSGYISGSKIYSSGTGYSFSFDVDGSTTGITISIFATSTAYAISSNSQILIPIVVM